ncbi:hypothetical protein QA601_07905 [Chitinispirillales bacterium ANBcel5]|uniref:hypothetical protein n=1 Tax=Cellulosispirillum alkaliphilum TaxID=3039283 RepID=UPI002A594024|nr:hypothetical protein [Chitinispirillales bacterium ANBcel5]
MSRNKCLIAVFALLFIGATASFSRSIIEKRMWYLTTDNQIEEARFWALYLGNHEIQLTRRFPGEGEVEVEANMNFQILSSGYAEGNGASTRGRVDCHPTIMISTEEGKERIQIDSIDYIYDFGDKVVLNDGTRGDFVLDAENNIVSPNRFLLRKYALMEVHGEQVLSNSADEVIIMAVAFSREGILKAQKEEIE